MADQDDPLEPADTVPPPASGDAYSAETVQRQVPPELLAEARMELLKRPRVAKKKLPVATRRPLTPAPLPHIERLFADEDSEADNDETLMRPMPSDARPRPQFVESEREVLPEVAESVPSADLLRHDATHPTLASSGGRRAPTPRRSILDGWVGSALIFGASFLLVLLIGIVPSCL